VSALADEFWELETAIKRLLALFEEVDEKFWSTYLRRGLLQVQGHRLSGATYVLGCLGGQDTLSELIVGAHLEHAEPLRYRNQNARLSELRTAVFDAANVITSRRSW
jgi:hypothetical protein